MKKTFLLRSLLFTAAVLIYATGLSAQPSYLITEYGAKGDSSTLNTKAIQACIDKCSVEGGGTVIIPKGVFISGSIFLKPKIKSIYR